MTIGSSLLREDTAFCLPFSAATMAPSLMTVTFVSLAMSSLFYGLYVVLFALSVFILVRRRGTTRQSGKNASIWKSVVFVSAILLFLVITVHWITTMYRAFIAFVSVEDSTAAEIFLLDPRQPTDVIQDTFLSLSLLIGDFLIIYRLWIVWSFNTFVLVVPVLSATAFTVGSAISTDVASHSITVFSNPWLKINTSLTLITNVYCTGFITWKIWEITRLSPGGTNLRHFVVVVVESAAFYALWAVFFVIAFAAKSNVQFVVVQTGPEVVGIVNALILTRVGLGWTSEHTETRAITSALRFAGSGDGTGTGTGTGS
ncbi:hypothetical protein B0H11DRAFT_1337151 [Mycena galericulata]|nr:hypothetical protein B0H11DRAFT_1337151 [Mycena galericulata]